MRGLGSSYKLFLCSFLIKSSLKKRRKKQNRIKIKCVNNKVGCLDDFCLHNNKKCEP